MCSRIETQAFEFIDIYKVKKEYSQHICFLILTIPCKPNYTKWETNPQKIMHKKEKAKTFMSKESKKIKDYQIKISETIVENVNIYEEGQKTPFL